MTIGFGPYTECENEFRNEQFSNSYLQNEINFELKPDKFTILDFENLILM